MIEVIDKIFDKISTEMDELYGEGWSNANPS